MRHRIRLERDEGAFLARITPAQAAAHHRALTFLRGRALGATALAVQLGTSPETVDALAARMAGAHQESFEIRLTLGELHVLHSALTATAIAFLERGMFSEEEFYREMNFYRENYDSLALGIVQAASEM
ncbi:hypothetical protein ABIE67_004935 [Streptomyces sp. V4I8]|uniref:hypothetical protein n=1 Tax=Streptomyces sp. V4I8 TaxID=3156469 RepID=UPI003516BAC9